MRGVIQTGYLVPVRLLAGRRGVAVVGSSRSPSASLPGSFRLTFWPRLYHPKEFLGEIGLRKNISAHWDRLLAQNVDAHLAGIVIWADGSYLDVFARGSKIDEH